MTLTGEPPFFPRLPDQQAEIMPGSSLAVVALITEIVRERFRDGSLPWKWKENPTPAADEENTVDEPRTIVIEPAFSENDEIRNFRPSVSVEKGTTTASKLVTGNFTGQQIKSGLRAFYSIAETPIEIRVNADKAGESAIIADIIWFYLLAGREQIQKTFGLQDMSNPVLSGTSPQEADKRVWTTRVNFSIGIGMRWSTLPISPILRDMVMRYKRSGETDPDAFLLRQYFSL